MVPVTVATDVKATKTAVDVAPAPAPSIQKTLFANGKSSEEAIDPAPAPAPAPPIKKIPTFDGKQLSSASSMKPENEAPKVNLSTTKPVAGPDLPTIKTQNTATNPDRPSAIRPVIPPTESKRQSSTPPKLGESKADAWEKAEIAKIKERYKNVNATILTWENKKKTEAKHKLNERESDLGQRRMKALQRYRSEMNTVNQIAGGARAQAEERQRNEELRAKEKANIIRKTGNVPKTCFCF
ncbi:Remorin_C domain-containing protein [Cephalotus follicularis]|uniref:Remorin_C domain-containing protein n=1 Tax=Cephalotus follicularis TaxID=3775 RepID=A0A1Q3C313_CEPFO|nr:Remorin_C domain-containing protein [Cephalotus follicularis]